MLVNNGELDEARGRYRGRKWRESEGTVNSSRNRGRRRREQRVAGASSLTDIDSKDRYYIKEREEKDVVEQSGEDGEGEGFEGMTGV